MLIWTWAPLIGQDSAGEPSTIAVIFERNWYWYTKCYNSFVICAFWIYIDSTDKYFHFSLIEVLGRLEQLSWPVLRDDPLGHGPMLFTLGVFFIGICHIYGPAIKILAMHPCNRKVRTVKIIIADKPKLFAGASLHISHHFGWNYNAKCRKNISEHFFIHVIGQISHKNICADLLSPFILWSFIDFNWFSIEFDHMHNFDGVVSIFFRFELDEAIAAMLIGYFVSWKMYIENRATL